MSRPLIPPTSRYRSRLQEESTVAAKKGGWCHLCNVNFPVGERITFVRGDYKPLEDPADRVHPDCLAELPDAPTGERSDLVVGYLRLAEPHYHKKYAVHFPGEEPWYTGVKSEALGAVKFCVECLGFAYDENMEPSWSDAELNGD